MDQQTPSLSSSSRHLLQISTTSVPEDRSCLGLVKKVLVVCAGPLATSTELPWIPVSIKAGGGKNVKGILLAQGASVSMILVKWVCYRDLIYQVTEGNDEEAVEALGEQSSSRVGTVVRVFSSLAISGIAQTPLAYQVGHANHSIWKGVLGGAGDIPFSWWSVNSQLRSVLSPPKIKRVKRRLGFMKAQLIAELRSTIHKCNNRELSAAATLHGLNELSVRDSNVLHDWSELVFWPTNTNEGWFVKGGRLVADGVGTVLTLSHLWMLGGLAYKGTEELTDSSVAATATGIGVAICNLGLAVESIGAAPRRLWDGVVGWFKGERPLFPRYNTFRLALLTFATFESIFAIGSAIDGAEQTTSGTWTDVQRPLASTGVALMAWWGWSYVSSSLLHAFARKSRDSDTRTLAALVDRLSGIEEAIKEMSDKKFVEFLLDLPYHERNRLLLGAGLSHEKFQQLTGVEELTSLREVV